MTAFCVVSLKYTDVSDVRTASIIALIMVAVHISQTSVYFCETSWRCIPEGLSPSECSTSLTVIKLGMDFSYFHSQNSHDFRIN
jgi:hypothetical protein